MQNNTLLEKTSVFEELFTMTIQLYWSYLEMLETAISNTPETDTVALTVLNNLVEEVQDAIKDDLAVFEKAVLKDQEHIQSIQDQLKIKEIYKNIKST